MISFCNGNGSTYTGAITTNNLLTVELYDWYSTGSPRAGSIGGLISGSGGITAAGSPTVATGTLSLNNTSNNYTGPTTISYGTLIVNNIANGGVPSQIGASTSDGDNLVVKAWGILRYTGPAVSSDRLFGIGMPVGGTIDSSGSGPMTLTNTGTMGFGGTSGVRALTLTGTALGKNVLNAVIADNGGATALIKSGSSAWMLNGLSTYTGVTTVNGGMLGVNILADGGLPSSIGASSNTSSNLVINSGTLQYTGTGSSTNRQMQVGPAVTIDASGSGPVKFTYSGWLGFTGTAARVLTLTGTSTSENVFAHSLNDWYGATSVVKNGSGTWGLTTQCGMTGGITVNAGTLELGSNTTQWARGDITVNSGGTLLLTSSNTNHVDGNLVINGGSVDSGAPNSRYGSYAFDFGIHATGTGGTLSATGMTSGTSGNEIPVIVDAGATLNVAGAFGWSAYSYNPAITKSGSGTMILSGSNSTTGTLTVNGGTLQIGKGGTTGSIASNSIVDNSALVFNRADSPVVSSVISGSGTVSQSGSGTLILVGANTYSGGTVVNSGTLQLGNGTASGSLGTGAVTNNAAMVINPGASTLTVANAITGSGIVTMHGAGSAIMNGVIAGAGSVVASDTGSLVLNGSNSYTGGTFVNAGILQINSIYSMGAASGAVTFGGTGGTLRLSSDFGSATSSRSYNFSAPATIDTNGAANGLSLTGTVAGSGALTKTGAGVLALNGVNTFTGAISVNGGSVELDAATLGGNTVSVALGAKLNATGASSIGGSVSLAGNGGSLSTNAAIDLTGGASGLNTLNLTGTGTVLTVGGASLGEYSLLNVNVGAGNSASLLNLGSGTLLVKAGGLSVNPNALAGATIGSAVIISAGDISNYTAITTPAVYGQTAGSFGLAASATNVVLNWALGVNPDTAYWNGGLATGLGSVWFVAAGQTNWVDDQAASANVLVPGANTEIHLSSNGAGNLASQTLGANGTVKSISFTSGNPVSVVDAVSTLNLSGSGTVINVNNSEQSLTLAVTVTGSGAVVIDNGTLQIGNGGSAGSLPSGAISGSAGTLAFNLNHDLTIANVIGGGLHFTQSGSGILTLSSSNSFSGGTTVNGGTIRLGADGALGAGGGLAVNAGIVDLNGHSLNVGGLSGGSASTITSSSAGSVSLTVTNPTSSTFAGTISDGLGQVSLSVTGSGAITLSGSSSYSGGTTLDAGTSIAFSKSNNLGSDSGVVMLNGGTLVQLGGNDTFRHSINAGTLGGMIDVQAGRNFAFNNYSDGPNAISGSGPITVTGSGKVTLSSKYNVGYSGHWTFNGGIVEVQDGGSASLGTGPVTLGSGAKLTVAWGETVSNAITSNGGALSFNNWDGGQFTGPLTLNSTTTVALYDFYNTNQGRIGTLSGNIDGLGGLTVSGPNSGSATLTLSGSNSYAGGTNISRANVIVNSDSALGAGSGSVSLSDGAALRTAGSFAFDASRNFAVSSGTATIDTQANTNTVNGALSGAGVLAKSGSGTLVLAGSVSIGGMNVNSGAIQLVQSGSIGALTVSGSGAVALTAHTGGNPYTVLDTSSLSITPGGSMDLWNNAMILRASGTAQNATNLAAVQAEVNSAKNGLLWNGVGIGSTTAYNEAQPPLGTQALALMVYDNSVINQSSFEGVSGLGYFDGGGQPVGYNQVLVKLTYLGDFNADGVINASDYTWLDGFALSGNALGDLNGDGFVNATDYTWLDGSALNQGFGVLAGQQSSRNGNPPLSPATASVPAASPEAVPEPGTWALMLGGLAGLAFRRRHNRKSTK